MQKALYTLLIALSTIAVQAENMFTLNNTTASGLEVTLRLGSETKKYLLKPEETQVIKTSSTTCLNKAHVLGLSGDLASKQDEIKDVKGCSGKTIFFINEDGKLKISGLKVDTSPVLGNKNASKKEPSKDSSQMGDPDSANQSNENDDKDEKIQTYS